MKLESFQANSGLDRLATYDEIRTALGPKASNGSGSDDESAMELRSDTGGYVRIDADEFNFQLMIGELTS